MKVHVLKVRHQENLDEMEVGVRDGHTVNGWQMPKGAEPGDLAVWYAAWPDQEYRAWGGWPTLQKQGSVAVPECTRVPSLESGRSSPCRDWR